MMVNPRHLRRQRRSFPSRFAALVAVLIALTGPAAAALAPNYERIRELGAILQNQELIRKLGIQPIEGIETTGQNAYRIWTAKCIVVVTLVAAPNAPPILGPWQFTMQVGEPECH